MSIMFDPGSQKGTVDGLRAANLHKIMMELLVHTGQTKLELARSTGLSMSTVSDCINRLTDAHLLSMQGTGVSSGGRKPLNYAIDADFACILGVYLQAETVEVALTDMTGKERQVFERKRNGESPLHFLFNAISEGLRLTEGTRVAAIGIGLHGTVETGAGIVLDDPELDWANVPLRELVERRYGIPAYVEHAAYAACTYQILFGAAKALNDFVCALSVFPDKVVLVMEGRSVHGATGHCGELSRPEDIRALMQFCDLAGLITDREDLITLPQASFPQGDYLHIAKACGLMAETRWFGTIYELSKGGHGV